MTLKGESPHRPTYVNLTPIRGGSAPLVSCQHEVLGTDCVQKTVPSDQGSTLYKEPRLLEQLRHAHIPEIVEAQHDPERRGYITFVMRRYAGGSVAQALVQDHRFSLRETVTITRHILEALGHAYVRHGYVHRDVKTGNVLLDETKTIGYLTDWELAEVVDDSDHKASAILSTIHYLAPEIARDGRHGIEADIYGIGLIMFEMLNGRFLWEQFDRAAIERRVQDGHRSVPERMVAPGAFAPHVPPDLVRIVRRAYAIPPASRFRSPHEFIQAIDRLRLVDWRHQDGRGLEGTWLGDWPPRARPVKRDVYRITSRMLERGRNAGMLRLVADYRKTGTLGWRRIGLDDVTCDPADTETVRQLFRDVEAKAAHRRPEY